ncbi:MAG: hypothetical protein GWO02_18275 [Gammaproteobacteria bacterium]|nr:hypothetical protein [Gammaproteobacteria bacterium]
MSSIPSPLATPPLACVSSVMTVMSTAAVMHTCARNAGRRVPSVKMHSSPNPK